MIKILLLVHLWDMKLNDKFKKLKYLNSGTKLLNNF